MNFNDGVSVGYFTAGALKIAGIAGTAYGAVESITNGEIDDTMIIFSSLTYIFGEFISKYFSEKSQEMCFKELEKRLKENLSDSSLEENV